MDQGVAVGYSRAPWPPVHGSPSFSEQGESLGESEEGRAAAMVGRKSGIHTI